MRTRTKVLAGFAAALGIAMLVAIASYLASGTNAQRLDTVSGSELPVQRLLADIAHGFGDANHRKEQASGTEQVTRAISEVGQVTQRNAASSEESSSAAQELSGQAEELAGLIAGFRLERARRGARPARAERQRQRQEARPS